MGVTVGVTVTMSMSVSVSMGGEPLQAPIVRGAAEGSGGGGSGEGPCYQGRPGPVILENLNCQRGDQCVQAVGHVGQHHLLVGIAADADVDGTGLER